VRNAVIVGLGLVGCVPIYDAQYDDRRRELEAFRTEFLPAENRPSLISSAGSRLFWADSPPPNDLLVLHSFIPGEPGSTIDYTFQLSTSDLSIYRLNDQIIIDCDFGTSKVFASDEANTEISSSSVGFQDCAVDGGTIYALVGQDTLRRWDPPAAPVEDFFSFPAAGLGSAINGFAVEGNRAIALDVTGDLYTIDLAARTSKWLRNDEDANGKVFFDDRGVLYESSSGLRYIEFADVEEPPERAFADMVADGGYHMNLKHGDIQEPLSNSEFTLHGRHVIYRGLRGIFAYGLDTGNVIDLLLDEGESIDTVVDYGDPTVTADGQLFVRSGDGFDLRGAVYQLDLNGRLK
jgi:hypothetical protein